MISVVDYGRGNLFSIGQALRHLDLDYEIVDDPHKLKNAGPIILPGVGAFEDAMNKLAQLGLDECLQRRGQAGVPIIGICLGMQLLVSQSTEFGVHKGLGMIAGTVNRLPSGPSVRIPNVGWRQLNTKPEHQNIFGSLRDPVVYFTHSYAVAVQDPQHEISTITFGEDQITAVIGKDNFFGLQFHPAKSGLAGLKILNAICHNMQ